MSPIRARVSRLMRTTVDIGEMKQDSSDMVMQDMAGALVYYKVCCLELVT